MVVCAVYGCKSSNKKGKKKVQNENISFHRFPKDASVCKQWIVRCSRSDNFNIKTSRICSKHFNEEDFANSLKYELLNIQVDCQKKILKEGAIPKKNILKPCDTSSSDRRERKVRRETKLMIETLLKTADSGDQPIFLPENPPVSQSEDPLATQPEDSLVSQSEVPLATQPEFSLASQSEDPLATQPEDSPVNQPKDQPVSQPEDPPVNQPEDPPINQPIHPTGDDIPDIVVYPETVLPHNANEKLKQELRDRYADIEKLKAENLRMAEEIQDMKKAEMSSNHLKQTLKKIFTPGQIRIMQEPDKKRVHWSAKDITHAIAIHTAGPKAYRLMKKYHYPLPGESTLRRWELLQKRKNQNQNQNENVNL